MAVTLPQLLDSRDARRERQQQLLRDFPGEALVVLTVNIPGNEKRTDASIAIGREGVKALSKAFDGRILLCEERDLETGFEAFIISRHTADEAKRICMKIEREHPLGRLFDVDVIGADGTPLSRSDFGGEPRKCLICDNDARSCMRQQTHSVDELLGVINSICDGYFQRH